MTAIVAPAVATLRPLRPAALAILGVCTAAIAQPAFHLLGSDATFFVAHRSSASSIVWFALLWFFGPPLVVLAFVSAVNAVHRGAGNVTLVASIGVLGAVGVAQAVPGYNDWPSWVAVGSVLVAAPLIALLYRTREGPREFLKWIGYLSPGSLVLFLFFTPVNDLVFADEVTASGQGAALDHDVVVVVFDELSLASMLTTEGNLDAVRVPNFARLSEFGTWYENATTPGPRTQWAVPTALSGVTPALSTIPIASEYPQNLFTTFAPSHDLEVDEIVTRLCPTTLCEATSDESPGSLHRDAVIAYLHTALPGGLAQRWLPPISDRWTGFGDDPADAVPDAPAGSDASDASELDATDVEFDWILSDLSTDHVARWNRFVAGLADNDRPTLSYMHSGLPHVPYSYLSDGRLYNGQGLDGLDFSTEDWAEDQQLINVTIHRYLHQVEYTDALLGRLLDELEANGSLDDTLLVVMSDHGTSLTAGTNRRIPEETTLSDIAQVPLFIKYPGQQDGEIDDRPVELIDVFPTIADVMGVVLDEPVDGQSLVSGDWMPTTRSIIGAEEIAFEESLDIERAIAVLGSAVPPGTPAAEAYGMGAARPLVGSAVESLELGRDSALEVLPTRPGLYARVDLAGAVPAHFIAAVRGADRGTHVVLAVNGIVAGSGVVTELDGSDGLAMMLDPEAFTNGTNVLSAFEFENGSLRPARVERPDNFALVFDAEGRLSEVVSRRGTWTATSPGARMGIDGWAALQEPGAEPPSSLSGWAVDVDSGETWEHVLLVDGDQVLVQSFDRVDRVDVADLYGDSTLESGFFVELDRELGDRLTELSVVVLFADGGLIVIG